MELTDPMMESRVFFSPALILLKKPMDAPQISHELLSAGELRRQTTTLYNTYAWFMLMPSFCSTSLARSSSNLDTPCSCMVTP